MKQRGEFKRLEWTGQMKEKALRSIEHDVFIKVEGNVTVGVAKQNETNHVFQTRQFKLFEENNQRIVEYYGYVMRTKVDGQWYDVMVDSNIGQDGCRHIKLKKHTPWTDEPDERFFLTHKYVEHTGEVFESFKYKGYFLRIERQSKRICMKQKKKSKTSLRRSVNTSSHDRFELFPAEESPQPTFEPTTGSSDVNDSDSTSETSKEDSYNNINSNLPNVEDSNSINNNGIGHHNNRLGDNSTINVNITEGDNSTGIPNNSNNIDNENIPENDLNNEDMYLNVQRSTSKLGLLVHVLLGCCLRRRNSE